MSGEPAYSNPYGNALPGSTAEFLGLDKMMQRERAEKIAQAKEMREKLTRFEKLADPNNEEMQKMLKEMKETTELLERNSGMSNAVKPPADNERVDDKQRGFYIP